MANMNLGGYQPPSEYNEKYKDPDFFAHAYRKYVDELGKEDSYSGGSTPATAPPMKKILSYEDRNDEGLSTD